MDPLTLTTVALIATKFAEGMGESAAKTVIPGLGRLVVLVRERLQGDREGESRLAQLERQPADDRSIRSLAEVLDERLGADGEFRRVLGAAVAEIQRTSDVTGIVTNIGGSATVGKLVNITEVHGDVSL